MNPNGRPLFVRADANAVISTGHVMRCIAIAQAWQNSGDSVTFVMAGNSESIESRLSKEEISILHIESTPGSTEDAFELVGFAGKRGGAWIVIDGYHFYGEYQRETYKGRNETVVS
jgi:spore coat polysaccharide biosynthesis predicted glycosyltransferase SpsG